MGIRTVVVRPIIRQEKEVKKPRDWAALSLSILSLIVSCCSIYFTALLQMDDIRLVIDDMPSLGTANGSLVIDGNVALTWVNSGNRAAAVLRVSAMARRLEKTEKALPDCEGKNPFPMDLGIEPFTLKPGDITRVQSKLISGFGMSQRDSERKDSYEVSKNMYAPAEGDTLLICVVTKMVTPDDYIRDSMTALYKYTFKDDSFDYVDPDTKKTELIDLLGTRSVPLYDSKRPISLVGRNRWFEKFRSSFGLAY